MDVVVHGLGNGDDGNSFLVHPNGVALGVVAADGDQAIEIEMIDHLQYMWREVYLVILRQLVVLGSFQEFRDISLSYSSGIRSRRVQERPAGSVDGSCVHLVQGQIVQAIPLG